MGPQTDALRANGLDRGDRMETSEWSETRRGGWLVVVSQDLKKPPYDSWVNPCEKKKIREETDVFLIINRKIRVETTVKDSSGKDKRGVLVQCNGRHKGLGDHEQKRIVGSEHYWKTYERRWDLGFKVLSFKGQTKEKKRLETWFGSRTVHHLWIY